MKLIRDLGSRYLWCHFFLSLKMEFCFQFELLSDNSTSEFFVIFYLWRIDDWPILTSSFLSFCFSLCTSVSLSDYPYLLKWLVPAKNLLAFWVNVHNMFDTFMYKCIHADCILHHPYPQRIIDDYTIT